MTATAAATGLTATAAGGYRFLQHTRARRLRPVMRPDRGSAMKRFARDEARDEALRPDGRAKAKATLPCHLRVRRLSMSGVGKTISPHPRGRTRALATDPSRTGAEHLASGARIINPYQREGGGGIRIPASAVRSPRPLSGARVLEGARLWRCRATVARRPSEGRESPREGGGCGRLIESRSPSHRPGTPGAEHLASGARRNKSLPARATTRIVLLRERHDHIPPPSIKSPTESGFSSF